MNAYREISQEKLKDYFLNNLNSNELSALQKSRQENDHTDFILLVVDKLKDTVNRDDFIKINIDESLPTLGEMQDALLDILGDNISAALATQFTYHLLHTENFYDRFGQLVNDFMPLLAEESSEEIPQNILLSQHEIFQLAGINNDGENSEKKQKPDGRDKGNSTNIFPGSFSRKITYSLGFAASLVILFASYFFLTPSPENINYTYYVTLDKVPYPYNEDLTRATEENNQSDALPISFTNKFKTGISYYLARDYAGAISVFEGLQDEINQLQSQAPDSVIVMWLDNYHFYLGLSYLALSIEPGNNKERETANLKNAIDFLTIADNLAQEHTLLRESRATYFLGLAHKFAGNPTVAVSLFRRIQPESKFYDDSVKLIQSINN